MVCNKYICHYLHYIEISNNEGDKIRMQLEINETQRELKSHGCFEFPVFISQEVLSRYERGSFTWHWHPEIELTLIMEGQISYQVNDQIYQLHEGDGLFCNANALHTGHMIDNQDCYYISTTFHPRIIYGFEGSILQRDYVNPLVHDSALGSIPLYPSVDWHRPILEALKRLYTLYLNHSDAFEMEIQQSLSAIWLSLYRHTVLENQALEKSAASNRELERLRHILTFIQEHYMEKITLDDIAAQIHICKSECCRFFKKHMRESLFDYLLYYRVEKSLPLLAENQLSITEISAQTGFSSPGYFSRIFREQMHCSPTQYRVSKK